MILIWADGVDAGDNGRSCMKIKYTHQHGPHPTVFTIVTVIDTFGDICQPRMACTKGDYTQSNPEPTFPGRLFALMGTFICTLNLFPSSVTGWSFGKKGDLESDKIQLPVCRNCKPPGVSLQLSIQPKVSP